MRSSRNQSHNRGRPQLGTLPHFSQHSPSRLVVALILVTLTIFPQIPISPRPVRASDSIISVTIANYAFQPQRINITTGTEVIWTNDDGTQHTVTSSQTNMTQEGPLISSGPLNQGQSFSYVFYKHGFYPYLCGFHTYMTGWVNVTGSDVQPPPSITTPSTDYIPYAIGGAIAGAIVVLSVALFMRRRTKKLRAIRGSGT